jgi:iron(III) transport system permease protein
MSRGGQTWLERESRGLVVLVALCALLFAVLPFGRLLIAALAPGGQFNPAAALAELSRRGSVAATWNTLESGLISALFALVLGTGVALVLVLTNVRRKGIIAFLFVLSMLMAPQVVALGFLMMAGPSSPILNAVGLAPPPGTSHPLLGRTGVILLLSIHHAPLVFITVVAGLRALPRELMEAASLDGASGFRLVRRIVLPMIRPHLVAGGLLAFVAAVGNFGIPALLGMPVNYLTLPTLIFRRLSSFGPSIIADAAALSVLIALIAGLGVLAATMALRRSNETRTANMGAPVGVWFQLGGRRPFVEAALWLLLVLTLGLPLLSLLAAALVPTYGVTLSLDTVTLSKFAEVLLRQDMTLRAFRNSFLYSAGAAVVLATLAVLVAYALDRAMPRSRRAVEALIEIPYALPGIVLAIACILLFLRPLPVVNVSLYATPAIILFAYAARFLPMALKPTLAAMAQLSRDQEEAAAVFGAGFRARLIYIVLPALLPSAVAGGLLVFLTAFNELTVSALLWSSGTETLGVALFNLEEAGLVSEASAVAVSATLVILVVMLVLDRFADRMPEGVLPWRL